MQKTLRKALLHSVTVLVLCMLCLAMALGGLLTSPVVYADTVIGDVQMDCSDVMEDLESSTIDGKPFDISDYAFDESEQTQVIMFAEYCYSFYANRQENYGLYVYVWNPQGLKFTLDSTRNKISLRTGKDESVGYTKYTLLYLDQCDQTNYEELFLKFKVMLKDKEKEKILESLKSDERVYSIGEIELLTEGAANATASAVSTVYTFSGFAKGYGSDVDAASTLTCTQEKADALTLDVHSTVYRTGVSNGENLYTEDSLHSVYFAVPNDFISAYGEISAVHATWLNAVLAPALVTGNADAYAAISEYIGVDVSSGSDLDYFYLGAHRSYSVGGINMTGHSYGYSYNNPGTWLNNTTVHEYFGSDVSSLQLLFYAAGGANSADGAVVSSERITEEMLRFTQEHGGELVNGKYSRALFSDVDEAFTEVNIHSSDTFSLAEATISENWWKELFGMEQDIVSAAFNDVQAIQAVTDSDITGDVTADCERLYIATADYDDFVEFYNANKEGCTVYLFRYQVSDYIAQEATLFEKGGLYGWKEVDTNAYFFQETVNLDFDVIDVTFSNGEKSVVLPVVSSPVDVIPDATPPLITTEDSLPWWAYAAAGLAAVVVLLALRLLLVTICGLPSWVFLLIVVAVLFTAMWWFDPFATWLYGILSKWLL